MSSIVTLNEFVIDRQADFPYATGDLSRLLTDIGIASKIVNHKINKAGLSDILGAQGSTNVQGEDQQKLDVFADDVFVSTLMNGGMVCGIASEENDKYVAFNKELCKMGKYVVVFDPLDGSLCPSASIIDTLSTGRINHLGMFLPLLEKLGLVFFQFLN